LNNKHFCGPSENILNAEKHLNYMLALEALLEKHAQYIKLQREFDAAFGSSKQISTVLDDLIDACPSPKFVDEVVCLLNLHYGTEVKVVELYTSRVSKHLEAETHERANLNTVEAIIQSITKENFDFAWDDVEEDGWDTEEPIFEEESENASNVSKQIELALSNLLQGLICGESAIAPKVRVQVSKLLQTYFSIDSQDATKVAAAKQSSIIKSTWGIEVLGKFT
jgi:hypothetical protein